MKKLIALALFVATSGAASADSPLTSTDFWKAYGEIPAVKQAHDIERLNTTLANYLLSLNNSIDKKAAVINALNWNFEGKQNAMLFREVLGQKYKMAPGKVDARLTADETFCLAYLMALDDYFHVNKALTVAEKARHLNSKSFTVAIVSSLIEAQAHFSDQKKLWPIVKKVLDDPKLSQDLRPKARAIITDYMKLYAKLSLVVRL